MHALAAVGVDRGEDCGGFVDAEEMLIEGDLRRVSRISLLQAVAIQRAPAFVVDALRFPQARIGDVADLRAVDEDAVSMTGQQAVALRTSGDRQERT
jgi:hypothetical protein